MVLKDFGRGARIQLAKMAKQLGMKLIGYNPTDQQVSLEHEGKGITYELEDFINHYNRFQNTM